MRIFYATQVADAPPRFVLFTNRPKGLGDSYLRYLENGLREAFGFAGVPVALTARAREQTGKGSERAGKSGGKTGGKTGGKSGRKTGRRR